MPTDLLSALGDNREIVDHSYFMREALTMSRTALENGEIPVGCVIVESRIDGRVVIAAGSNQTNESRNGTRHAEIVAVESLYAAETTSSVLSCNADISKGMLSNCDLYVTCEPCIMCAAALSKLGIRKVYFGCHNDRFGGNGSILSVHSDAYSNNNNSVGQSTNSSSAEVDAIDAVSERVKDTYQSQVSSNSYHKYDVQAGLLRDEAIELFQHFYTSENRRAPEAKRKRKVDKTFNSNTSNVLSEQT